MKRLEKKLWLGLFVMAILSPLGIILPEKFAAEGAWGEWGVDALEKLLGYIPRGLKKTADIWAAPIRNYNFGGEGAILSTRIVSYIVSAFIGIVLACIIILIISRLLFKHEK
ncbi:MAG: cobalamin biosynthesis protein [Deltaproteobacteria bacterium]|nr:MAG: cobalamin biosynthesis protein [Deltaproteobacteria bacterium]